LPRRSNLFQEVIAIIQRHTAGDARVEESAMLRNRLTDRETEVDVVITTEAAGYVLTISVEATAQRRPAPVGWVDRMVATHEHLSTDKLILVSEAGFTAGAREAAEARGVLALAPSDLSAKDPAHEIVNRLKSLWPKEVMFSPRSAKVVVRRPDRERPAWFRALPDTLLVLDDGSELGMLADALASTIQSNFAKIAEQIGLARIATDLESEFTLQVGSLEEPWTIGVDGTPRRVFARWEVEGPVELHPVLAFQVLGDAAIHVGEIALQHARLGEVMYSYGEGKIGGRPVLVVITEGAQGGQLTIRARPRPRLPSPLRPASG